MEGNTHVFGILVSARTMKWWKPWAWRQSGDLRHGHINLGSTVEHNDTNGTFIVVD